MMSTKSEHTKLLQIEGIYPAVERESDVSNISNSFHIKIESVDGIAQEINGGCSYYIQAVLFDKKYGKFFGNFWEGKPKFSSTSQINFKQNFYFHTSIPAREVLVVFELIILSKSSKRLRTCGWAAVSLSETDKEDLNDRSEIQLKVSLLHGTPISLLSTEDTSKKGKKKKKKKDIQHPEVTSSLVCLSLSSCPQLLTIAHLVPQNILIDETTDVPGLASPFHIENDAEVPLQDCITFLLENVCLSMLPSREEAEKDLVSQLLLLYQDITPQEKKAIPKRDPSITQRRLQVSVHNGLCFIQEPDYYHLHIEPPATPSNKKSLRRIASVGTLNACREEGLVMTSDVKISKIPNNPKMIIVFLLEYSVSLPKFCSKDESIQSPLNQSPSTSVAVAWGYCRLGTLRENPYHHIVLTCSPSPFSVPFLNTKQEFLLNFSAVSLLKQNKDYSLLYPSEDRASILSTSDLSGGPSFKRCSFTQSTPKHKSIADIPMYLEQKDSRLVHKETVCIVPPKQDNNLALQEVTLVPSSMPLVVPLLHSFPLPNGATFSKLYWDKLQSVLDEQGKAATVIDVSQPYTIDVDFEMRGPPQRNECMIQILAFSGLEEFVEIPNNIFFTFQFYRFLPIRSESLMVKALTDNEDSTLPQSSCAFVFLKQNMSNKTPGFQVTYDVDPSDLMSGEAKFFSEYLMKHSLHIDLWNGQSLLYFGTAVVPLKYLCRQGREAIVANLELDIVNYEFPDESLSQNHVTTKASMGKLHIRLANIRHPLASKALGRFEGGDSYMDQIIINPSSKKSKTDSSLSTVSRARKLAEIDQNLSRLLSSLSVVSSQNMSPDPRTTEERRRKLARMEAVRNIENNQGVDHSPRNKMQFFFNEKQRELGNIQTYIQKNKSEIIQSFLQASLTVDKVLFPSVGSKSFFEFVLENPYEESKKVEIIWKSEELSLITDPKLWKTLRQSHSMSKKVEPLMFSDSVNNTPTILLQPNSKVQVPFYYQCWNVQNATSDWFKAVSGHHFTTDVLSSIPTFTSLDSPIKVKFVTEDRSLLGVLNLKIQPLPPVFTHTFKFMSMEHSMFKKSVQINSGNNIDYQLSVKSSHPEIISTIQSPQDLEEDTTVHIKAPTKAAGKCAEFYVFIYKDMHRVTPFQLWSISICPLQRIDLSCIAGQLMRSSLLIRGSHATHLVRCCSSSKDLLLNPSDPFVLSPFAVQELSMNVRTLFPGTRYFQITMVNQSLEQVLQSWLLVLSSQKPTVSKAFQVQLSLGKETAKRITYTNPYHQERRLIVHCSHPRLLRLRESDLCVGPGQGLCLGMYFGPQDRVLHETVFLYLNDAATDKNEETYCIKVICQ